MKNVVSEKKTFLNFYKNIKSKYNTTNFIEIISVFRRRILCNVGANSDNCAEGNRTFEIIQKIVPELYIFTFWIHFSHECVS